MPPFPDPNTFPPVDLSEVPDWQRDEVAADHAPPWGSPAAQADWFDELLDRVGVPWAVRILSIKEDAVGLPPTLRRLLGALLDAGIPHEEGEDGPDAPRP